MFKFLRSKAKVFYWVIAASFILFIFLAWGMDVAGSRGGSGQMSGGTAGTVNGETITVEQWQQMVRRMQANLRRQASDREVTSNQLEAAAEQAWEQLVRGTIFGQEIERRGITVTDDEVLEVFRSSPPPELLMAYADESGVPDLDRYYADLANPARDWSQEEAYIRAMLPSLKLQEMLTAGVTVSEAEVEQAFHRQNSRAVAEIMGVIYADLESDWEPSDEQVQAHYESRPALFEQPEQIQVEVAVWPKEASHLDRTAVEQDARELRQEILRGEIDFAEAARLYSQDSGSAERGGDLGTFDRNRMVQPFTEAAFDLEIGEISEPVATQYGFHLIEVLERIPGEDGEDGEVEQVHARHILFNVDPGEETVTDLYGAADSFRKSGGQDFAARAEADSIQLHAPQPFARGRDIPGLFQSAAGASWAFRAKPGTVSPVFENDQNFYVVLLRNRHPAGPAPLDQVRSQIVVELKRDHKRELARELLSPAVGEVQMGGEMARVAEQHDLVHAVTDTITATSNIPETGYATALNEVALAVEPGTLVPEVETPRGLFAVKTLWRSEPDRETFAQRREQIRQNLLVRKQQEALEAWFEVQLSEADLVDRRAELQSGA
ncbi:MAG: peptidylprolyl isomerase [Candidatus Krumholzibacteriia bacterium]